MSNPLPNSDPFITSSTETQGIPEIRQKTIAALITRGFTVKYTAKKLKMSESRIYHLLADKDSVVNTEIKRILRELFASGDRHLISLYTKVLQKLDAMLSSPDEEKQYRAMDRIIKMFVARTAKNAIIQEAQPREFTIDDYILFHHRMNRTLEKERQKRGLPPLPRNVNSADLTPEDSSDFSPDDASPHDSSSHNSSPAATSTDDKSTATYSPDISPEIKGFLDTMK